MGAWGTGILEDDTSLRFLESQLLPQRDPRPLMRARLQAVVDAHYIGYDDACAALTCAAVIRTALTGVPLDEDTPEWNPWCLSLAALDFTELQPLARKACRRVLSEDSELYQLWQDNDELFAEWKRGVEALARSFVSRA